MTERATAADSQPVVRIALVEDHAIFRQGLRSLFDDEPDIEIVGEASDGDTGLDLLLRVKPDVAVIDLSLPRQTGLETWTRYRDAEPGARAVVLTSSRDPAQAVVAAEAGVLGYVLKDDAFAELVRAVREAHAGRRFFSPGVSSLLVGHQLSPPPQLSPRERQVLDAVAAGDTNRRIASSLGLSVKTIESHRSKLMQKLGVGSAPEMVRKAIALGLISPQP